MGEEGVVLKDGVDLAVIRRQAGDVLAPEIDAAGVRLLEAGDHSQGRGLARARGPEQREELAPPHLEVERRDSDHLAVALAHLDQVDVGGLAAQGSPGLGVTPRCLARGYRRLLLLDRSAGWMCAPYNAHPRAPRYIRASPRLARPGWPIFPAQLVRPDFDVRD